MSDVENWLHHHADALYRYARLRVRADSVAEDLVQETFLAALRNQDQFEGRANVRTWLTSILRNKIFDHYRARSGDKLVTDADLSSDNEHFSETNQWRTRPADWGSAPDATLQSAEFQQTLKECIAKLPSPQREIFCLRELDQQSTENICKMFTITPTNLWTMIHRAKLQLRSCLQRRWFGGDDAPASAQNRVEE